MCEVVTPVAAVHGDCDKARVRANRELNCFFYDAIKNNFETSHNIRVTVRCEAVLSCLTLCWSWCAIYGHKGYGP